LRADKPPARAQLASPQAAIDVFDFERLAADRLHPAHWTYLSMGVQGERTLRANRDAFARFALVPRRLHDVRRADTELQIFGQRLKSPILLAPVGSLAAYHPDAEGAVAKAARAHGHHILLSHGSSTPLAEVAELRGDPLWSQVYASRTQPLTRLWTRRAEAAGCSALVLTVDIVGLPTGRDRIDRFARESNPDCQPCHDSTGRRLLAEAERAARAIGLDPRGAIARSMMLDWDVFDRIRDTTSMPIVLKGILSVDDAERALEHGVDAILVSNHGGRSADHGLASLLALDEIAPVVAGRVPLLVDGGFRRGTDVVTALALGAQAVCVGRPYVWGLAGFGQPGVEGVLELLQTELLDAMRQLGRPTLTSLDGSVIRRSPCSARDHPDH
jgi:isopentenyl diphosphate isomerase/L-lactate dehydrogenase-like FMN-dependent dehydrogenase